MRIDAEGIHYRQLNERIHQAIRDGEKHFILDNVRGQRYIGTGLDASVRIVINGVPGQDLAAFMNGAEIIVHDNVQDGTGNTMNKGKIVVHGDAGDVLGHAMRGGKIFVRDNVGYRAGIHIKAYQEHSPVVVVGGTAKDYFGEYMAGGMLIVLGLKSDGRPLVGEWLGTGMHGGLIYLRGNVEPCQLGREVGISAITDDEWHYLKEILAEYKNDFGLSQEFTREEFQKFYPVKPGFSGQNTQKYTKTHKIGQNTQKTQVLWHSSRKELNREGPGFWTKMLFLDRGDRERFKTSRIF